MHGYIEGNSFGNENETRTSILILLGHLSELEGKFKVVSQKQKCQKEKRSYLTFLCLILFTSYIPSRRLHLNESLSQCLYANSFRFFLAS